jgi:hypothetical protein
MDAIKISVTIGEDRKLVLELPSDVPVGKAELTIQPVAQPEDAPVNPTRDEMYAKLLADGKIRATRYAPEDAVRMPDEELMKISRFPPGAPTIADLINEERDER